MNEGTRSGKSTIRLLGISAERSTNGLYLYLYRETQNRHFIFNNVFFPPENLAVCEIMWRNIVELNRP
jgi:hypothetical protein